MAEPSLELAAPEFAAIPAKIPQPSTTNLRASWTMLGGGILLLLAGYFLGFLSPVTVSYGFFSLFFCLVAISPFRFSVGMFFVYIGFQGFLKLLSNYSPLIHVGDDLMIIVLLGRAAPLIFSRALGRVPRFPPYTWVLLAHLGWFLVSFANPYSISLVASLASGKLYVSLVSLYFVGYVAGKSRKDITFFIACWVAVAVVQAIVGGYHAYTGPKSVLALGPQFSMALLKYRGFPYRPFGLTSQPGGASLYCFLGFGFGLFFILHSRKRWIRLPLVIFLPIMALIMVVCQVRATMLKTFFVLCAMLASAGRAAISSRSPQRFRILGSLAILFIWAGGLGLWSFNYFQAQSSNSRRVIERAFSAFEPKNFSGARGGAMDRFVSALSAAPLGSGLGRTGSSAAKFAKEIADNPFFREGFFTDNLWVGLAVDLGVPGVVLYNLMVGLVLFTATFRKLGGFSSADRALHTAIIGTLWAVTFGFYGSEPILYNPEGGLFWFFSGVLMRFPYLDAHHD